MAQSIKQVGLNPIPRTVNVKRPQVINVRDNALTAMVSHHRLYP